MNITQPVFQIGGIVGSVVVVYFAIRVAATILDVLNRWRTGNWEV